jgi:hypothetical protein
MGYEAGTVIECKIQYDVNGQQCYNVLHYVPDSLGGVTPVLTLQDTLAGLLSVDANGFWVGEIKKILAPNVLIQRVTAQAIYPTRYRMSQIDLAVLGTDGTGCTAQNVHNTVEKVGVLAGRHYVGSVHTGGMDISRYAGGLLTAAAKVKVQAYIDQFLSLQIFDVGNGVSYTPAIQNKIAVIIGGKTRYRTNGATPVFKWHLKSELRTSRTRTVGHGI